MVDGYQEKVLLIIYTTVIFYLKNSETLLNTG